MFSQKNYHITFETKRAHELINITGDIDRLVSESAIDQGMCMISVPHTTACLIVNEDEDGLKQDILGQVLKLAPEQDYQHNKIDTNARAHIINAVLGTTKLFSIERGSLKRGTWQDIFFVELDGPRFKRSVDVEIMGSEKI